MVRVGLVGHTSEWAESGYHEIQKTPNRYRIINTTALLSLVDFTDLDHFHDKYKKWLDHELMQASPLIRDSAWSKSLAVGSQEYIEQLKNNLGSRAGTRSLDKNGDRYLIQEST